MPLPKPNHKTQNQKTWLSVCMGNKVMNKEFPDQSQRAGICYNLWKKKESKATFAVQIDSDQYLYYTITPEDEESNPLNDSNDDSSQDKPATEPENPENDTKADESKKLPSLSGPGINPNQDNSKNFPIRQGGDWENPKLKDQKWFLAESPNLKPIQTDTTHWGVDDWGFPLNDSLNFEVNPTSKPVEWYIGQVDEDYEMNANWPLSFDQIEKDFKRPNKETTPETKLKDKQSKENEDTNKIDKQDKPFSLYFDK